MQSSVRDVLPALFCVVLAACGGGGGSSTNANAPAVVPSAKPITTPTAGPDGFAKVSFTIGLPGGTTPQGTRKPAYVPASTTSITLGINGTTPQTFPCTITACSGSINAPAGAADTFVFTAIDTASNALATVSVTQTILPNGVNTIAATLQGIIAGAVLTANPPGLSSATNGTSVVSAAATDVDGDVITGTYAAPLVLTLNDTSGTVALTGATLTSATATAAIAYTASTASRYVENHMLLRAGSTTETTAQRGFPFEVGRTFYTFTANAIYGFRPGAVTPAVTIPIAPALADVRGLACDGSNVEVLDFNNGGGFVYGIAVTNGAVTSYTSDLTGAGPIGITGSGNAPQAPVNHAQFYVANTTGSGAAIVGFQGTASNQPFALPPNTATQTSPGSSRTDVKIDANGNVDAALGGQIAATAGYEIRDPTLATVIASGQNMLEVGGSTQIGVDNTTLPMPRIYTQELNTNGNHGQVSEYDNYAATPTYVSTDNDNAGLFVDPAGRVYTSTAPGMFHVYLPGTLSAGPLAYSYSIPGQSLAFDSAGYVYALNGGAITIYPPGSATAAQTIPGTTYGQPTQGPDTFGTFCQ